LFQAGEMLGMTLATIHNLHFYLELMRRAKQKIAEGVFEEWALQQIPILQRDIP
jgi:queuine tRNA-ribosyltransferase